MPFAVRLFLVVVIFLALVFGGLLYNTTRGRDTATEVETNAAKIAKNRAANEVACRLLVRFIQETGVAATGGRAASAQEQRAVLRLAIFERLVRKEMTVGERVLDRRLTRTIRMYGGGQITVPDCAEVAAHPERVKVFGGDPSGP